MVDISIERAKELVSVEDFAHRVIAWQQQHGRNDLPWQQHNDPYHVLVSELMLQQTQVSTVIPYFAQWLQSFPDVASLARAEEQEVMAHWQGLGYYRRARNLHAAAKSIVTHYQGQIPQDATELREIPGVGPYTVGAIRAFAFDAPAAIVDGNVKRLFARLFKLPFAVNFSGDDKHFWTLSEHFTPPSNNRRFAQGLLDLGATVCKPKQPRCELCPLQSVCLAHQDECVTDYPKRKPKKAIPTREGHFMLAINNHGLYLEQRPSDGIWPSLWCLPELSKAPEAKLGYEFKHVFSHYKLQGKVWLVEPQTDAPSAARVALAKLDDFGLPAPIRKLLLKIDWNEVERQRPFVTIADRA